MFRLISTVSQWAGSKARPPSLPQRPDPADFVIEMEKDGGREMRETGSGSVTEGAAYDGFGVAPGSGLSDSDSEACGEVHIPMPLISVLEIDRLQAALDDAASHWSQQYAHDPAFKQLLDTWAQGFVQLGQDIEHGRLTLDAMLERSQLLGTLLARAVKMADAGGWTTCTREYMFDLGSVYGEASIIQNDWNMAPVLVQSALVATVGVAGAAGVLAPMTALYAGSAIKIGYAAVQLGFTGMLPLKAAGKQSRQVARSTHEGPRFMPNVDPAKALDREGNSIHMPDLQDIQAEHSELAALRQLHGQASADPMAVCRLQQRAQARQRKWAKRFEKRTNGFRQALIDAWKKDVDIGATGRRLLFEAAGPLEVFGAAPDFIGTAVSPSAKWFIRTRRIKKTLDTYTTIAAQLAQALQQATLVVSGGATRIDADLLGQALAVVPPALEQRLREVLWEWALAQRFEAISNQKCSGINRAGRLVLNAISAIFALLGNTEKLSTVEQDIQSLLSDVQRHTTQFVAEAAGAGADHTLRAALQPALEGLHKLQSVAQLTLQAKWEILSVVTLVVQVLVYGEGHRCATWLDQENKLAIQFQLMALMNVGPLVKQGRIHAPGLDAAFTSAVALRMNNFLRLLEFDSAVYLQAIAAFLVDRVHTSAARAQKLRIALPPTGQLTGVSCTFTGIASVFQACSSAADRAALVEALAAARDLPAPQRQALDTLLGLYEANQAHQQQVKDRKLQALLGPESQLPPATQLMLRGALRYALVPRHLPPEHGDRVAVQRYMLSAQFRDDAEQDARLAQKRGNTENLAVPAIYNQVADKFGNSFPFLVTGSGPFTAINAISTLLSELLRLIGGHVNPLLNTAALATRIGGNALSIGGAIVGTPMAFAAHVNMKRKNDHRQRDRDLKIRPVVNSSPLSDPDAAINFVSMDWLRHMVSNYSTLADTPIPQATLPAPLLRLKQLVAALLPHAWAQSLGMNEASAALPRIPPLRYESISSLASDIREQMLATKPRDWLGYFFADQGSLAELSDAQLQHMVAEAAEAIAGAIAEHSEHSPSLSAAEESVASESSSSTNAAHTPLLDAIDDLMATGFLSHDIEFSADERSRLVSRHLQRVGTLLLTPASRRSWRKDWKNHYRLLKEAGQRKGFPKESRQGWRQALALVKEMLQRTADPAQWPAPTGSKATQTVVQMPLQVQAVQMPLQVQAVQIPMQVQAVQKPPQAQAVQRPPLAQAVHLPPSLQALEKKLDRLGLWRHSPLTGLQTEALGQELAQAWVRQSTSAPAELLTGLDALLDELGQVPLGQLSDEQEDALVRSARLLREAQKQLLADAAAHAPG